MGLKIGGTDRQTVQQYKLRQCTPQHGINASLFSMPCPEDRGGGGWRGGSTLLLADRTPKHIPCQERRKFFWLHTKARTWLTVLLVNKCHSTR